jgi:beta-lactamase superfamily II metal-dependent hydrolase
MAASKIEVSFLHCDQGMGTLVRIFDSLNNLAHLALIDLGSEAKTKKYAGKAIESVISALKQMQADGVTPAIDLLVISHQDTDHWSLLPDLLKQIQSDIAGCEVHNIYYGGTNWKANASKAIEKWEDAFDVEAEAFAKGETNYKKPGEKKSIQTIDGVAFRLLCVNVPISRSAPDLNRNGTSAVLAIDFGGVTAVIPGDATADTVGWINDRVFVPWEKKGAGNPVQPCRALGAPHHGALRTIASNYVSSDKAKLGVATTFANYVAAQHVVASAGYLSDYWHPYKNVMELLAAHAFTDRSAHDFVWFNNTSAKYEQVEDDERGIYTTVRTLAYPPKRLGWRFTITSAGVITFERDWEQAEDIPPFQRVDRYPATPHER